MLTIRFLRGLVLVAALGYLFTLDSSEARGWSEPQQQQQQDLLANQVNNINAQYNSQLNQLDGSNLDRLDSDDDDEDDERLQLQPASLPQQASAGSDLYQLAGQQQQFAPLMAGEQAGGAYPQQQQLSQGSAPVSAEDLGTAASKHYGHHKGHGAKGWLDMGAWTGKKGAFGWYDKHPVGKGK